MFQFTHPGRGATSADLTYRKAEDKFQFTHPGRGATGSRSTLAIGSDGFNSRTPGGVRPDGDNGALQTARFNSRTPGGVRLQGVLQRPCKCNVSFHAPREGCDRTTINICHAPTSMFQFTHPGRGATYNENSAIYYLRCFNSRTPGGVRLRPHEEYKLAKVVSIHAPREGCDFKECHSI